MATTRHKLMDGRVQVYSRPNTPYWVLRIYLWEAAPRIDRRG